MKDEIYCHAIIYILLPNNPLHIGHGEVFILYVLDSFIALISIKA